MDKRKLNNETGITIIALSITIIVMLILAGISIATVSPMIKNSEEAKQEQDIETEKSIVSRAAFAAEKVGVKGRITKDNLQKMMQNELPSGNFTVTENGDGFTITFTDSNRSYNVDATGGNSSSSETIIDGVTIPAGYYYVGGTKAKGLVISDNVADNELDKGKEDVREELSGNQWVWVPVETPSSLYTTVDAGVALDGSTGVKTTKYTNSEIISGKTRVIPGVPSSTDSREPDLVLGSDEKQYDYANYATAGFSSLTNMAETMVSEYDEMIRSIEKYKGFYIGRYELTANGEKTGATQTNVNWYTLYKNCTTLAVGSKVKTRMIWGLQWDATCNWLASSEFNIIDSTSWGNYKNNTADGHGSEQNTGYSESWKANNIYDFAGNCYEITQEADNTSSRASRGGVCHVRGSLYPASYRGGYSPTYTGSTYGSRPTLYLIP